MKKYLLKEKGRYIYDSLTLNSSKPIYEYKESQHLSIELEIDLCKMIHYNVFLGENFIRCLFRYYPMISQFTKETYI